MSDKPLKKLSPKHRMFCEHYLINFCGAKAAREAGVSSESARAQACYFLHDPLVKKYLKKRSQEIMAEINEQQLKIFRELMNVATSDIRRLYDSQGNILPLDDWPEDIARCVGSIKQKVVTTGRTTKKSLEIKLWNKNPALENLARVIGLLKTDVSISLSDNGGSIYFPLPKEIGAPVDEKIIMKDQVLQLHLGGKNEKEGEIR